MQEPKSTLLIGKRTMQHMQLSTDEAKGALDRNFDITFVEEMQKLSKPERDEHKRITDGLKEMRGSEIEESKLMRDELIENQKNFLKGQTKLNPRNSFAMDGLDYQEQMQSSKNTFKARHDEREWLINVKMPDKSIDQIAYGLVKGFNVIDMVPDEGSFLGDVEMSQKVQDKITDLGYDQQRIVQGSTSLLELMQSRRMIDQNQRETAFERIDQGLNNNVEQVDRSPGEHLTYIQIARKRVDGRQLDEQRDNKAWGAKIKPQEQVKNENLILTLDDDNKPIEKPQIGRRPPRNKDQKSPGGLDNSNL